MKLRPAGSGEGARSSMRPITLMAVLGVCVLYASMAGADEPGPCREISSTPRRVTVPASGSCVVAMADAWQAPESDFPRTLYVIRLEASDPKVLVSATFTPESMPAWKPVQGPTPGVTSLGTDTAAARHELFSWSDPKGALLIVRQDSGGQDSTVTISVDVAPLARAVEDRVQSGHAERLAIDTADHQLLAAYGRCVRGDPLDDRCLEDLAEARHIARVSGARRPIKDPVPFAWQEGLEFTSAKDRITAQLYYLVARWIGRDPAYEFSPLTASSYLALGAPKTQGSGGISRAALVDGDAAGPDRGSQSEPVVLFIGVGGVSRVVLLDCHHTADVQPDVQPAPSFAKPLTPRSADELPLLAAIPEQEYTAAHVRREVLKGLRRCYDFAGPQARALERAEAFWAVSIEDLESPFDTTIEVEFGTSKPDPAYEGYDPRITASEQFASDTKTRTVRITWRQFRLRETPGNVEVAFTRQGPGYGLRQWRRVFLQRSKKWYVPAVSAFIPSYPASRSRTVLTPVYVGDSLVPGVFEAVDDRERRGVFGLVSIQWPQVRGKADDTAGWYRFLLGLVPDAAVGVADHRTYFTGGSWPISLWGERTSITIGSVWALEQHYQQELTPGMRISAAAAGALEQEQRLAFRGLRVGLSFDLFKLKK